MLVLLEGHRPPGPGWREFLGTMMMTGWYTDLDSPEQSSWIYVLIWVQSPTAWTSIQVFLVSLPGLCLIWLTISNVQLSAWSFFWVWSHPVRFHLYIWISQHPWGQQCCCLDESWTWDHLVSDTDGEQPTFKENLQQHRLSKMHLSSNSFRNFEKLLKLNWNCCFPVKSLLVWFFDLF